MGPVDVEKLSKHFMLYDIDLDTPIDITGDNLLDYLVDEMDGGGPTFGVLPANREWVLQAP